VLFSPPIQLSLHWNFDTALPGKLFPIEQCRWEIDARSLRLTVTNFLYVWTIHFGLAQGENIRRRGTAWTWLRAALIQYAQKHGAKTLSVHLAFRHNDFRKKRLKNRARRGRSGIDE